MTTKLEPPPISNVPGVESSPLDRLSDAGSARARWLPVAVAVSALLLFGALLGGTLLVYVAIAVALVVLANYLIARQSLEELDVTREPIPGTVAIGQTIRVRVSLHQRSRWGNLWLLVEDFHPRQIMDRLMPPMKLSGERLGILRLPGRGRHELEYEIHCHRRGYVQVGPMVVESGDVMGLFRRFRVATPPVFVTVLPSIVAMSQYTVGSRRPIGEIRMRESVMDDPTRLRGIRHWQPGDPMRSVHWAATARTGTLHSKIYEPSSMVGATILIDMHVDTNPDRHEPVRGDLAATMATAICNELYQSNDPFGLVTNGRDAADRMRLEGYRGDHRTREDAKRMASELNANDRLRPVVLRPDRGAAQFERVHHTLARLERTDAMHLDDLVVECEAELAGETTVLAILQMANERSIAALIGLARRGRAVAVILNTHLAEDFADMAGPLVAENIPVFHLPDADGVRDVCRNAIGRV
ncbi:MAG: DUF58 domain-containing protein [Planctomycetota bacterium]